MLSAVWFVFVCDVVFFSAAGKVRAVRARTHLPSDGSCGAAAPTRGVQRPDACLAAPHPGATPPHSVPLQLRPLSHQRARVSLRQVGRFLNSSWLNSPASKRLSLGVQDIEHLTSK